MGGSSLGRCARLGEVTAVLGASSPVGACVLARLLAEGREVLALSRVKRSGEGSLDWRLPGDSLGGVADWLSVMPIWALPGYLPWLEACGARRLVVLSSTSRFAKADSSDVAEQAVASRLAEAEACVQRWAASQGVALVILRPTLIYGSGRDQNVAAVARFLRRFHFFPLAGGGCGLRQPVHVEDVAQACVAALSLPAANGVALAYALSGAETLSFAAMVRRIAERSGVRAVLLPVPLCLLRVALRLARVLPMCRSWTPGMVERMNRDQVFGHEDAARDLGFSPRRFDP